MSENRIAPSNAKALQRLQRDLGRGLADHRPGRGSRPWSPGARDIRAGSARPGASATSAAGRAARPGARQARACRDDRPRLDGSGKGEATLYSPLYILDYKIDEVDGALAAGFKRASRLCQQVAIRRESPAFGELLQRLSHDSQPVDDVFPLWTESRIRRGRNWADPGPLGHPLLRARNIQRLFHRLFPRSIMSLILASNSQIRRVMLDAGRAWISQSARPISTKNSAKQDHAGDGESLARQLAEGKAASVEPMPGRLGDRQRQHGQRRRQSAIPSRAIGMKPRRICAPFPAGRCCCRARWRWPSEGRSTGAMPKPRGSTSGR